MVNRTSGAENECQHTAKAKGGLREFVGFLGVTAYVGYDYYDTSNVAKAAMALISKEVVLLEGESLADQA